MAAGVLTFTRVSRRDQPAPPRRGAILESGEGRQALTASMLARRLDWAALLDRVFGADVTTCSRCGDPSSCYPSCPPLMSPPASSSTSALPPRSRRSLPLVPHLAHEELDLGFADF